MHALDFPLWLRGLHFCNLLFVTLLVRSGLEILGAHPKLSRSNALRFVPHRAIAAFSRRAYHSDVDCRRSSMPFSLVISFVSAGRRS